MPTEQAEKTQSETRLPPRTYLFCDRCHRIDMFITDGLDSSKQKHRNCPSCHIVMHPIEDF